MAENYDSKPLLALIAILIIPWLIIIPIFLVFREVRVEYMIVGIIFVKIILLIIWKRAFKKE